MKRTLTFFLLLLIAGSVFALPLKRIPVSDNLTAVLQWNFDTLSYNQTKFDNPWINYTPILAVSGGTAPTYTTFFVNRYKVLGKTCFVNCSWYNLTGGTAGAGVGQITITLPIAASKNLKHISTALNACAIGSGSVCENGGTTKTVIPFLIENSTTQFGLLYDGSDMISGNDQSTDRRQIGVQLCYEVD